MDDLQFRRTIYADPHCADDEVKLAASDDPKKQQFWNEIKQLDAKISQASKVSVPDDLAHKLILRQSLESQKSQTRHSKIYLAIAASVIFTFGLSFSIWQQQNVTYLGEYALAHVQHEGDGYALKANGDISLETVNAQLASLGAEFKQSLGRIYYANFCNFGNIRSYHLVMEDINGERVTVFVVPHSGDYKVEENFANERMSGQMFDVNRASVIIVGDKANALGEMKYRLKQNMLFSA
ncbi:DUF3379 domain-containing protein [Aliiglaciecola litoralis]|uniref:DUF3379 domain-containing protein n=2 Tax=Aliiglaciecola litoralis TaxID=582857 RepID=A0ABP3WPB7_9ALTE